MSLIALLIIIVGLISIVVPLRFLGVRTRLRGLAIAGLGFVLLILTPLDSKPPEPTISDPELKDRAQGFDFASAARNPDQCEGKLVRGNGKVIQVAEGWGNSVTLRVNVTRKLNSYGNSWDDTVLMRYRRRSDTESRILDDDLITFWGRCEGVETYTTVLGHTMTIPSVDAQIVTVTGKD